MSFPNDQTAQIKPDQDHHLSRRNFLKFLGLALAGGASAPLLQTIQTEASQSPAALPVHPNIVLLITDQERYPQHWPIDFDFQNNLPGRWAIAQNGMTFRRAYCNSAMCSPSRANLFTGMYPAQHGLDHTLTYNYSLNSLAATEKPLPLSIRNLANMLASAGYRVILKGKWHLSKHADGNPPDSADVAKYGFTEWVETTAGEATDPEDFGGGCANWDGVIGDQAVNWLQSNAPYSSDHPFCLIVSLANPHDLLSYPDTWDSESTTEPGCFNYRDTANFNHGIPLPPTFAEDLVANHKPAVQQASLDLYAAVLGTIMSQQNKLNYVNFYADLQMLIDQQIVRILNELQTQNLKESTVIIRVADHGEMGLSHGGLRQKMFNAYEETVHVPLVISNPIMFPSPIESDSLVSLVDIMPTLAAIANIPASYPKYFKGHDLSPILSNPTAEVQDTVLFTFDDDRAGTGWVSPNIKNIPHHIQAMVHRDAEGEWKFARYFNPEGGVSDEYEMYHLQDENGAPVDPTEMTNLAADSNWNLKRDALKLKLAQVVEQRLAPLDFLYLPGMHMGE